jgi:TrkA domain protein
MNGRGEDRVTSLPGVGDRHEFWTAGGECVGVVRHAGGDRELVVFSQDDPDSCRVSLRLRGDDARRLAALLGEAATRDAG